MEDLPFIRLPGKPSEKLDDVVRATLLELNNHLTIPMKIIALVGKPVTDKDKKDNEYVGYWVKVESCADVTEFDKFTKLWLLGANTQNEINRVRQKEKQNT